MEESNHSIIWDSVLVSTGWTDEKTKTFCRIVRLWGEIQPKTWIQCRRDNHLRSMLVCFWGNSPQWARVSSFTRFLDHTRWRNTVGRTPLVEWSARRRDLYLTTHNVHNSRHPCPSGIQTHNLTRQAAADLNFRPHGHLDQLLKLYTCFKCPSWMKHTGNACTTYSM